MSHGCHSQFWSINLKASRCLVLYFLTLPSFTRKTIPQSRSVYSTEIIDVSDWGDQPMFEELPLAVAYGKIVQFCWSLLRLSRKLLSPSTARLYYYQFHKAGSNIPYAAEQYHISGFKLFKFQIFKSTKMSFFFPPQGHQLWTLWTMATPEVLSSIYLRPGNTSCSLFIHVLNIT